MNRTGEKQEIFLISSRQNDQQKREQENKLNNIYIDLKIFKSYFS